MPERRRLQRWFNSRDKRIELLDRRRGINDFPAGRVLRKDARYAATGNAHQRCIDIIRGNRSNEVLLRGSRAL